MNDNSIITPFKTILDELSSFSQKGTSSYPSIEHYREQLSVVSDILLTGEKGITVFFDYDNDGFGGGVILYDYLSEAVSIIRGSDVPSDFINFIPSNRQTSFGISKDEFSEIIKDKDLVITVDCGSDIDFHTPSLVGSFLALDHHYTKNVAPYILNVNSGREEGVDEFSTSGGMVAYTFVRNLDNLLSSHIPEYKNSYDKIELNQRRERMKSFSSLSDTRVGESVSDKISKDISLISNWCISSILERKENAYPDEREVSSILDFAKWGLSRAENEEEERILSLLVELNSLTTRDNLNDDGKEKVNEVLNYFIEKHSALTNHKNRMFSAQEFIVALTLISDGAIMDKENRDFIKQAFSYAEHDPSLLRLLSSFPTITSRDASFGCISKLNGLGRMEKHDHILSSSGRNIILGYISPLNEIEFKEAEHFIEENNINKKEIVKKAFSGYLSHIKKRDSSPLVEFAFLKNIPIGLTGLIASRISNGFNDKQTIICSLNKKGDLVFSGRGYGVRDTLISTLGGLGGGAGGHYSASGGHLSCVKLGEDETLSSFNEALNKYVYENKEKIGSGSKLEVASLIPVDVFDFIDTQLAFKEMAEGVDFYKKIYIPLQCDEVKIGKEIQGDKLSYLPAGWTKASISSRGGESVTFWINGEEHDLSTLKEKNTVFVFEYLTNNDISLHSVIKEEDITNKLILISEAEKLGIIIKEKSIEKVNRSDIDPMFYFYVHPESGAVWSKPSPEIESDELVEELSEVEYISLVKEGNYQVSECKEREEYLRKFGEFILTDNPKTLFSKRFSRELVENNPDKIFVFGDNLIRKGTGGQAVIRGLENSFGIPTKRLPSMSEDAFFGDRVDEKLGVSSSLEELLLVSKGRTVVFPLDGVGTGMAQMKEKSPLLFSSLKEQIRSNFTGSYLPDNKKPEVVLDATTSQTHNSKGKKKSEVSDKKSTQSGATPS